MADWTKPTLSEQYTDIIDQITDRDDDNATMFDVGAPTSVPTGAIKWNSTQSRFEKWDGAAWQELDTAYDINAAGLTGMNATVAEINTCCDGATARQTVGISGIDGVAVNDNGFMKMVNFTSVLTYIANAVSTFVNKTFTSPVINTGVSGTALDTTITASATKIPTSNAVKVYADGVQSQQSTGTGTEIEWGSLPAGLREFDLIFHHVDMGTTGEMEIIIGDAGGYETTGYNCIETKLENGISPVVNYVTTYFPAGIYRSSSNNSISGILNFKLMGTDAWVMKGTLTDYAAGATAITNIVGGTKTLVPGPITNVKVRVNGGYSFISGQIRIQGKWT